MEIDTIETQVLFEIALRQSHVGSVESILQETLPLYHNLLNAVAVFAYDASFQLLTSVPKSAAKSNKIVDTISSSFEEEQTYPMVFTADNYWYYTYALSNFGYLVIVKKSQLSISTFQELSKVIIQLGRSLCQKKEEKKVILLQKLYNKNTDAVIMFDASGKIYNVNAKAKQLIDAKFHVNSTDFNLYEFFGLPSTWRSAIESLGDEEVFISEVSITQEHKIKHFELRSSGTLIDDEKYFVVTLLDITEKKQIEKQQVLLNQKLESILNEIDDIVWSATYPDFKLIFVTPSIEKIFGIKASTWLNDDDWFKNLPIDNRTSVLKNIQTQLSKEGKFRVRFKFFNQHGNFKWLRKQGKFIYDEKGNPIRIDGLISDRTSQYKAEELLRQEHELQSVLIDIASKFINIDIEEIEVVINESLERIGKFVKADRAYVFAYDFENHVTSNTYEWCADGITPEMENLQNVPINFFPQWVEKHQNGEMFLIQNLTDLDPISDAGLIEILEPQEIKSLIAIPMIERSELLGFVGFDSVKAPHLYSDKETKLLTLFSHMLVNVRSKKLWAHKILVQEEKFRNIIKHMNLGLLEVDTTDTILFANQSFCEMSGYALYELQGSKAATLFVDADFNFDIENKIASRTRGISESYELKVKDKFGEEKWWFVSAAPNFNDKGQLIGSIGIHLDITEQKILEKQLAEAKSFAEAAARAKELFLANMSHEIRTPLNVIIGMVRQLAKEQLNAQQMFYVKQSEISAKHLLTILNNILDVAKIESGALEINAMDFSLNVLLYNTHSIMFSQVKEKNLDFRLHVSPEIKTALVGDETRLRQVLINLIGNAIKFTNEGFIHVSATVVQTLEKEQTIRFEVNDSGIGISDEFKDKIFDKFSQEFNTNTRKYQGTGLGMAISYDLIKLMGGELKVESKQGIGTTFTFDLTLKTGNDKNLIVLSNTTQKDGLKGKKVLLVEDNEMNRFIAIQSLDYLGIETFEAENGQVAVDILSERNDFDLILMDIQMPVMDGVESTEIIRQKLQITTPIIALTANAFKHDIDLYLSKGMNDFIIKPYDENDFFFKIEHTISLMQKEQSLQADNLDEPQHKLFDLSLLEELSRGNNDFVKKMLGIFVKVANEGNKEFAKGLESKNIEVLNKTAHKLKPSIQQLKIISLVEPIKVLEKISENESSWYDIENLTKKIKQILSDVIHQIEHEAS